MKRLLLCLCLVLGGCTRIDDRMSSRVVLVATVASNNVYIFTTTDGTRCAVYASEAIDCDWQPAKVERQ